MLPHHHPDGIRIAFDDHRLVANAGLILPATLALRLPQLVQQRLDLGNAPGRATHWTGNRRMSPPSPCSRREGRGMAGPGRCQDSFAFCLGQVPAPAGFPGIHPGIAIKREVHPGAVGDSSPVTVAWSFCSLG